MLALLAAPCALAEDGPIDPNAPCTCWGDMDGDKKVSSADARLVLRQSVGLENYPAEARARCDIDKDNKVSSSDARLVLRCAILLDPFSDLLTILADADGDETVTPADARKVLRAAVGLEVL